ncbi:acyl carrier protein [Clostridium beijerinckii]|nr:acyl carrier protein [Clostridium beijerinckii]ALB45647.1 acyl carrier protein [Clostridium beijerinckii NRRL B-598]NSB14155.1 polyketide biosynthesis acyl carrier protein [Clostridium beijerinckii]NYC72222.1 polyketide biosynthesis acyl carrier protein [Clostridium beijerinckii]OOM30507.1 polyketide biosynthesis acyl-carrier-protein AcpK [Clostridium beijerinckii]
MVVKSKEEIFNIVKESICEIMPELEGHEFNINEKLVDLGANSVDRADIVMTTMETLNLDIPRVELAGVNNLSGLVDKIFEKLNK